MADNIQEQIEDKIIDLIALGSGGRLVVFKPENSAKSLIVEKKGDYKKDSISLKVCNVEGENFSQAAGKSNPEDNFYLVFVRFDIVAQDIDDALWVVPSFDLVPGLF